MNKIDYCIDKIEELERKLATSQQGFDINKVAEFSSVFADGFFTGIKTVDSPFFLGKTGQPLVFQIKLDIEVLQSDDFEIFVNYNGFEVYYDTLSLQSGKQSLFFMKSVNCISNQPLSLSLTIKSGPSISHKLLRIDYFVWGIVELPESPVKLSANTLNNFLALSLVSDKQLFLAEYNKLPENIEAKDFVYKIEAEDACVCYTTSLDKTLLHLFRVDSLGNLNYSTSENLLNEKLVTTNVSAVSCGRVFGESRMMVCYIKNARPFAKLFDNSFSDEIELPVPKSIKCTRASVVANSSTYVLVVVSTDSGANYLCVSNQEAGCVENINAKFMCEITNNTL